MTRRLITALFVGLLGVVTLGCAAATPARAPIPRTESARAARESSARQRELLKAWRPVVVQESQPVSKEAPARTAEQHWPAELRAHVTDSCGDGLCLLVEFNKPMVVLPLADAKIPELGFEPEPAGRWRWFDDRTLRFEPASFEDAHRWVLRVPAGLTAKDGTQLPSAVEYTWRSLALSVQDFEPRSPSGPIDQIAITFSTSVETTGAKRHFRVSVNGKRWPFGIVALGERVTLALAERAPSGSRVDVEVGPDLKSDSGPMPLGETFRETIHIPRVEPSGLYCTRLATTVVEGAQDDTPMRLGALATPHRGLCDPGRGIAIASTAADDIELANFLTVSPELLDAEVTGQGSEGTLRGAFQPGVSYEVTLHPRDADGEVLRAHDGSDLEHKLVGRFKFGGAPVVSWGPGQVARTADLERVWPVAVRNASALQTRSRRLDPSQLWQVLLDRETKSANIPEDTSKAVPPRVRLPDFDGRRIHRSPTPHALESLGATLRSLIGTSSAGFYEVELNYRLLGERGRQHMRRLVNVTDLGLRATVAGDALELRVTNADGKAAAGAKLLVREFTSRAEPRAALTEAGGVARIELPAARKRSAEYLVVAELDDDATFTRILVPASAEYTASLFADRGIYRGGEKVYVKGHVQRRTAEGARPVVGERFVLALRGRAGAIVERVVTTNDHGAVFAELPLADAIARTHYAVVLREPDTVVSPDPRVLAKTQVLAADYEPEVLTLDVTQSREELTADEPLLCTTSAHAMHGGALAGAPVSVTLKSRAVAFAPPNLPTGFTTQPAERESFDTRHIRSTLSATGRLHVRHRLAAAPATYPRQALCNVEVTGPNQQVRNAVARSLVHPALYLAARRPPELSVGETVTMRVLAVDASGSAVELGPSFDLEATLTLDEQRILPVSVSAAQLESGALANPFEVSFVVPPNAAGELITLDVVALTPDGHGGNSRFDWFVSEPPAKTVHRNAANSDWRSTHAIGPTLGPFTRVSDHRASDAPFEQRLTLALPETGVEVGQSVSLRVTDEKHRDAKGLLQVFGAGLVHEQAFALRDHRAELRVPISAGMIPAAEVLVQIEDPEQDRHVFGSLVVPAASQRLDVEVRAEHDELRPGSSTTLHVETSHRDQPAAAEVTLYVVDEASLQLTDYDTPDILPKLYDFAWPEVRYENSVADLIDWSWSYERSHRTKAPRVRMGGASVGDRAYRSNFAQTPLFVASLTTDEQGIATHALNLPDSVTTYRIMAVALTKRGHYGASDAQIRTAKPLMLLTNTPSNVWVGDTFIPSVAVTNQAEQPLLVAADVRFTSAADGLPPRADSNGSVELTRDALRGTELLRIEPGRTRQLRVPLSAPQAGTYHLQVAVAGYPEVALKAARRDEQRPNDALLRRWAHGRGPIAALHSDAVSVPVRSLAPRRRNVVATAGAITGSGRVSLSTGPTPLAGSSELRLQLTNSPLATLRPAVNHLLEYPYGCTEQLSSRILPHTSVPTLLGVLGMTPGASETARDEPGKLLTARELQPLIERVLANQHHDGGFGLWRDSAPIPELSAFVAVLLSQVNAAGLAVPREALRKLSDYSNARAAEALGVVEPEYPDAESALTPDLAALLLFAEQRLPHLDAARSKRARALRNELLKRIDELSVGSVGLLSAAWVNDAELGAARRLQLETALTERLERVGTSASAPPPLESSAFTSTTHETAFALIGLSALFPENAALPMLARGLLAQRNSDGWASTQQTSWALLALEAYARARPDEARRLQLDAKLGASPWFEQQLAPGSIHRVEAPAERLLEKDDRLQAEVELSARRDAEPVGTTAAGSESTASEGTAHYTAQLTSEHAGFGEEESHGLRLRIEYEPDARYEHGAELRVGDTASLHVIVESATPRRFIAVEVPLPAGVRAINPDYGGYRRAPSHFGATHYEYRDDRVLLFIDTLQGNARLPFWVVGETAGRFQMAPARAFDMYDESIRARTKPRWFHVAPSFPRQVSEAE